MGPADIEYYNSLIAQGYTHEQALFYTRQYYPNFVNPQQTQPLAPNVAPLQHTTIQAYPQTNQFAQPGMIYYQTSPKRSRISRNVWIGIGIAGFAVIVAFVLLIAVLFASLGEIFELEETPEFGFRHDVDAGLYEDLGANRFPFTIDKDYPDFSSTVNIYGEDNEGQYYSGSGVIISEKWVLTAAHVVDQLVASETGVYLGVDIGSGHFDVAYPVSNIYIHPGWEGDSEIMESGVDIALIKLSESIDADIASVAVWDNTSTTDSLQIGSTIFTAGYGAYDFGYSECSDFCLDDGDGEYSQRRAWSNVLDRIVRDLVPPHEYNGDNQFHGGFVVYDFDSPSENHNSLADGETSTLQQGSYAYAGPGDSDAAPLSMEGTSVQGDSGGPTYAYLNGQWTVIGLTAHGSLNANYGDVAFNTLVSSHTDWICTFDSQVSPILGCN